MATSDFETLWEDLRIWAEFDGSNHAALGRKYGLGERQIYNIIGMMRNKTNAEGVWTNDSEGTGAEAMIYKGDEVINDRARFWGVGTALNEENGGRVRVDFGTEGVKLLDLNHARLIKTGVAFGPALEINPKKAERRQ